MAVLDLDGRLLLVGSGRGWSRGDIARLVRSCGEPVLVGTDMLPVPKGVGRIASIFDCAVVLPRQRFRREEKEQLTARSAKGARRPWRNLHERDALAAALHAWGRYRPLLDRIRRKAKEADALDIEQAVRAAVIRKEGNITNVIRELKMVKSAQEQ